ncbi:MAG: hypothetical protein K6F86_10360 [Lachnospiraceae bacterium]|nr:hypothetical protein [Lachnospiraceae bacterium]
MKEELFSLNSSDIYPFHMPGHKRAVRNDPLSPAYGIDITEIEGFDALSDPRGMIMDLQNRAASYYGADHAFLLVNGSTCGVLAAISCLVPHRKKLLMARNSHKSAYDAVYLGELDPVYVYPGTIPECGISGSVSADEIGRLLSETQDIRAVFITSPTYEGILSDVDKIADTVHSFNIPLIVDMAHGAHLEISKKADIVITGLHKTLPAFTSSALCLVNGTRIYPERLKFFINIFQTSSPSYIIMAGMEGCFDILDREGVKRKEELSRMLKELYDQCSRNACLKLLDEDTAKRSSAFGKDDSKICIYDRSGRLNGSGIAGILREQYHIEPEYGEGRVCLCISSIMDSKDGFERLAKALRETDEHLRSGKLP